jgi:hypothetical protein
VKSRLWTLYVCIDLKVCHPKSLLQRFRQRHHRHNQICFWQLTVSKNLVCQSSAYEDDSKNSFPKSNTILVTKHWVYLLQRKYPCPNRFIWLEECQNIKISVMNTSYSDHLIQICPKKFLTNFQNSETSSPSTPMFRLYRP